MLLLNIFYSYHGVWGMGCPKYGGNHKNLHPVSPRCGVFVTLRAQRLRKGRKGFASFANGARLRVLRAIPAAFGDLAQRTRSPCVLCEASAPFAVKKHRDAVKNGRKILKIDTGFWTPHPIPYTLVSLLPHSDNS
jgi:hypothetical protein